MTITEIIIKINEAGGASLTDAEVDKVGDAASAMDEKIQTLVISNLPADMLRKLSVEVRAD